MIRTINIKGHRSFDSASTTSINFDPAKRLALLYGLNGSGKSAIGQVVYSNGNGLEPVPDCGVVSYPQDVKYQYLVYNEAFIDRSFRNRSDMPGIFTIGAPEAAALEEAENLEPKVATWRAQREALSLEEVARTEEASKALEAALRGTWKSFTALKDGPFKRWLPYGNSKQGFLDALQTKAKPDSQENPSLDELATILAELGDGNSPLKAPVLLNIPDLRAVEVDEIWTEPIVGSGDSTLAPLIRELSCMDWVSQGRQLLSRTEEICPFCQQGLPDGFAGQLAALFDASYERRLQRVQQLADGYASGVAQTDALIIRLLEDEPLASETPDIRLAWATAHRALVENVQGMREKILSPQSVVGLTPTEELLAGVRQAISVAAQRVSLYNQRLQRRGAELAKIERALWQYLARENRAVLELYQTTSSSIASALERIKGAAAELSTNIAAAEVRLTQLRAGTAGTERAIAAINGRLIALGIDSFTIVNHSAKNLYCLSRPGKGVDDYASLSEGEKTLITFLYFVELINGSEVADKSAPLDRKIVLIDDPISSLSHNYVYDIAATISRDVMALKDQAGKQIKQVIVLTHSLFFFNELLQVHVAAKSFELKRVLKNNWSAVVPMDRGELKNDYEAWWQVVRDARTDSVGCATLANAMRCILERFFYFTKGKKSWENAMKQVEDGDRRFVPLSRYLNHHSHADANTLTDFGDYDVAYCLAKLEDVFRRSGHYEHYCAMLGIEEAECNVE